MRCPSSSFSALVIVGFFCVSRCLCGQAAEPSQSVAGSALTTSPDGKTISFPGTFLPGNAVHFYFASQNASSTNTTDGVATLFASPVCTTSGCTVIADPLDPASDKFPWTMPDQSHFLDYREGRSASWYQNPKGAAEVHWYSVTTIPGDKGFPKSANTVHGIFDFNAIANNAAGWAYGLGGKSVTDGEYVSEAFHNQLEIHAAGITGVFSTAGTISKPDDVNYDNNNISINPAAYGGASEGVTFHRDYILYAPPYFGTILTGGVGARKMTLKCSKSCDDMSLYTPLIDTTRDVLSGNIKFEGLTHPVRGDIEMLSTDFDVPVSLYGASYYIPAQTNVQGLVFSATTSGSDASVATVAFDSDTGAADAKAVSVNGDTIAIAIKRADGTMRRLGDILELFAGGRVKTPVTGTVVAFPAKGVDVDQTATKAAAKALEEVAAPRQPDSVPMETTFALGTATPLVVGQMIDMMGPQFNEVTAPTSVGKLADGLQVITAPLYFSHAPAPFCANTSAVPGSGMVGRYIELTNFTKLTIAAYQKFVQTILCSPAPRTLLMGTIGTGSFRVYGKDPSPQPAKIYHGADLRGIFDPDDSNKTQQVNGPGYGTYAVVDANDTFNVGDTVENTPYAVQNWTKNKTFMDVEDPFATWHGYLEQYVGPGLNGAWMALINRNKKEMYEDRGGSWRAPDLMRISGVWGGGFTWDMLPSKSSIQSSAQPYLLYVIGWNSTTQKTLGLFHAGYGSILFNQGTSGSDSYFDFGSSGSRNGINAGKSSFDAVVAGQFVGGGATPSVATGAAAGRGSSVEVAGNNLAGVITLTTGTGAAASGMVAAVRFHGTLGVAPQGCSLMAREPNAASAATTVYTTAPDTKAWAVNVGKSALTDATTYVWSFLCM